MENNWPDDQENVFEAVLKIANFTHFPKEEILDWTIDEANKALEVIHESEQRQAQVLFAVADYKIFLDTVPTDDKGNVKTSEREDILEKARTLRSHFTGEKTGNEDKINNLDFINKNGDNVIGEMTAEEYQEERAKYTQKRKAITEQYGT
ncbi:MAG: hypothetical protein SGJ02_11715 [bacterium]|nr:hypothetical protein [bacterium]